MADPDVREILAEESKEWNEVVFQTATAEKLRKYWNDSPQKKHIARMTTHFSMVSNQNIIPDMSVITACVKATYKGKSTIIGYVYSGAMRLLNRKTGGYVWRSDWTNDEVEYVGGADGPKEERMPFRHCHLTHGFTYHSQDGEYRGRFIQWNYFHSAYAYHGALHGVAEDMIAALMNQKQLAFDVFFAYPTAFVDRDAYENSINDSRVCIKMFATCWIIDNWMNKRHLLPNHINLSYYNVMCDPDLFAHFNKKYKEMAGDTEINQIGVFNIDMSKIAFKFGGGMKTLSAPSVGQKLIPTHVAERRSPWNIAYSLWKEIYATERAAELVFNGCCVGFPLIHQWFFIENGHAGFFENPGPHDLYARSKHAKKIEKELLHADKMTRASHGDYRAVPFAKMSHKILDVVNFGESEIIMAPDICVVLVEDVGRTLADWPDLIYESDPPRHDLRQSIENYDEFARITFDWLSSLMQLHECAHVVHSDLHNNNITIFPMWWKCETEKDDRNESFAYVLDESIFLFPFHGCHGVVIDMSRAIFADSPLLREYFPEHEIQNMLRRQTDAIRLVISSRFGKFYDENRNAVEKAILEKRNLVFDALTAIDVISLGRNIESIQVNQHFESGKIALDPRITELGEKLIKFGTTYFMNAFNSIIRDEPVDASIKGNCARRALHEIFASWRAVNLDAALQGRTLVDCINCTPSFRHKLSDGVDGWRAMSPQFVKSVKDKYGKSLPKHWADMYEFRKQFPKRPQLIGEGVAERANEVPPWMYN